MRLRSAVLSSATALRPRNAPGLLCSSDGDEALVLPCSSNGDEVPVEARDSDDALGLPCSSDGEEEHNSDEALGLPYSSDGDEAHAGGESGRPSSSSSTCVSISKAHAARPRLSSSIKGFMCRIMAGAVGMARVAAADPASVNPRVREVGPVGPDHTSGLPKKLFQILTTKRPLFKHAGGVRGRVRRTPPHM
jgi:hypothetical protein